MGTEAVIVEQVQAIVDAALHGTLTREQAERSHGMGAEFNTAVLMAISARLAQVAAAGHASAADPHTPSGAVPPYAKPPTSRRRRTPGARPGHAGHRRPPPLALDRVVAVAPLCTCPERSAPVKRPSRRRRRVIEDIPQGTKLEAVGMDIPQQWCPHCRLHVEPRVAEALPNATIGNGLVALSTVFHCGPGGTRADHRAGAGDRGQPSARQHRRRRSDGPVTAHGDDPPALVRGDRRGCPGVGHAARRRDLMARGRTDALAVVLLQPLPTAGT